MVGKIKTYFFSLQEKERFLLIVMIYAVIILGGFFIVLPTALNFSEGKRKILKEKVFEYYHFKELLASYIPLESKKSKVTISQISNIAQKTGMKQYISLIKPMEKGFEIKVSDAPFNTFSAFLKALKKEGISVVSLNVNTITGDVKGYLVVSEGGE
ncbi:type II secretion system protein GspM [Desulfurobacterium atlanticum]|uniref:Type II secretion system (T2SS), protein M n=1 Tax=Desulfurobacterium atlanticum TaxID=240169 RepID=A0A238ZC21_9BACT|nr:type II secretion system protein GspM [Desulfurobacterium atlanticum]SNR80538.1 Type II secretion system (T2SS), protein M [Desulfurobacterium atlanticum]